MSSPYKRRKSSMVRNLWIYRRLVLLAMVLGVLLWFMLINNTPVTVLFPFRLASVESTTGVVILVSVLVGSAITALLMTVIRALRRHRDPATEADPSALSEDRPPADYAAKTTEGFPHSPWSS